jgi:hypothetical protein
MHDFNKYFAQIMANDNNNISKHSNKTLEKRKIKNTNTADKQKLSFDYALFPDPSEVTKTLKTLLGYVV